MTWKLLKIGNKDPQTWLQIKSNVLFSDFVNIQVIWIPLLLHLVKIGVEISDTWAVFSVSHRDAFICQWISDLLPACSSRKLTWQFAVTPQFSCEIWVWDIQCLCLCVWALMIVRHLHKWLRQRERGRGRDGGANVLACIHSRDHVCRRSSGLLFSDKTVKYLYGVLALMTERTQEV